ncbi:hypothetical protein ACL07V_35110 [Streptomyces sp. MB22_4]|uniref:hypothetical protein n=1 Tax=Streptomyces sp. MB22_4 TaxID=3383120 RepID=UPI00399EF443
MKAQARKIADEDGNGDDADGVFGEFTNGAVGDIRVYPTALPPADAASSGDLPKVTQLD